MFYNVSVTFQRNSFWKTFSERDSHSSINRFWKTLEKNGLLPNQKLFVLSTLGLRHELFWI